MSTSEVQCKPRPLALLIIIISAVVFPLSEREELLKEMSDLKLQIEEAKNAVPVPSSDSLLRGEQTKDIISK